MSLILAEFGEMIGTITFNNHEKRNCLSAALSRILANSPYRISHLLRLDPGKKVSQGIFLKTVMLLG